MSRTPVLLSLLSLIVVAVVASGCSDVKDAAQDKAGRAACSVAQKSVDEVASQVDKSIDEIEADPAAAKKKLSGLRDVLDTAQSGISGGAKDKLSDAADALGNLADEAGNAAKGADVDTSAISDAKDSFREAVDGVRDFC